MRLQFDLNYTPCVHLIILGHDDGNDINELPIESIPSLIRKNYCTTYY